MAKDQILWGQKPQILFIGTIKTKINLDTATNRFRMGLLSSTGPSDYKFSNQVFLVVGCDNQITFKN